MGVRPIEEGSREEGGVHGAGGGCQQLWQGCRVYCERWQSSVQGAEEEGVRRGGGCNDADDEFAPEGACEDVDDFTQRLHA